MVNNMPPSYNRATRPQAAQGNGTPYHGCVSKSFQVTGILHMVAGGLSIVLGIAAAVFKARLSYLAFPIWGGLLLFIVTGIIGAAYRCKQKSKCIAVAYLVMTIISATFSGIMFIMYSIVTSVDSYGWNGCDPTGSGSYYYFDNYCDKPVWVRTLMGGLLVLVFFLELACGITSAAVACFKVCSCCRGCNQCCTDNNGNANVVYYAANGGAIPMMTVGADTSSRPIYIPGGNPGSAQPTMYLAASPQAQQFIAMSPGMQQGQPLLQAPGQQTIMQSQAQQPPPQSAPQASGPGSQQQSAGTQPVLVHGSYVQAPPQLIQMVPAPASAAAYPQAMAAQQQQPPHIGQYQQQQQPGPQAQGESQEKEHLEHGEDVASEPSMDEAFGVVTSGQFSDQAALV